MSQLPDTEYLAVGHAVMRAAEILPEGYEVTICIERGAGTVYLADANGVLMHIEGSGEPFSVHINEAIEQALEHVAEIKEDA